MKKAIIISLIPIFSFLVPLGIISGGFFLSGCTDDTPARYVGAPPVITGGDGSLFSRSRFPHYNQLFGYPNDSDWMRLWSYLSDFGTSAKSQGNLVDDDYESFVSLFGYFIDAMEEAETEYNAALEQNSATNLALIEDDIIEVIEIASYTGIGDVLNELFEQLGRDGLYHHLYPMIAHYYAMPYETFIGMINTIEESDGITKISEQDFNTLSGILKRMFDNQDETYGPVWDAIPSAWDMIARVRDYGDTVTVKDGKDLLDSLLDIIQDPPIDITGIEVDGDENLAEKLSDALKRVWDNENGEGELETKYLLNDADDTISYSLTGDKQELPVDDTRRTREVRQEVRKLLYSVGLMMSEEIPANSNNAWDDHEMTDLERVLYSVEDILDETTLPRAQLESFLEGLFTASIGMNGANSLGGILRGVAATEPSYLQGLDHAIEYIFWRNREGVLRDDPAATSQTSAMRVLLYMLPQLDMNIGAGALIGSTDGCVWPFLNSCTGSRGNMIEWAVGEISDTQDNCPFDTPCTDPFDGWDYVLNGKNYSAPAILPLLSADGLLGFLGNPLVGGILGVLGFNEFLPAANVAIGEGEIGSTGIIKLGVTHSLIAPVGGIMGHFWKWSNAVSGKDWVYPMAEVAFNMNEISGATNFVTDPHIGVLKAVEGIDGHGLATYALRRHYDPSDPPLNANLEHGLLDPVLNMLVMVINELKTTEYTYQDDYNDCTAGYTLYPYDGGSDSCSLFSALMFYIENHTLFGLDMDEWNDTDNNDIGEYNLIYDLFHDTNSQGDTVLDNTEELLGDSHDILAIFLQDIGNVILAIVEDETRYDKIMDDIDIISDIIDKMAIDTDTGAMGAFSDLAAYFVEENEDGSDNQFVANMKALLFKIFDLVPGTENEILARHGNPSAMGEETAEDVNTRRQYYLDLYKNIDEGAAWWFKERNKTIAMFTDDEYKTLVEDLPDDFGEPSDFVGSYDDTTSLSLLFSELYGSDDDLKDGLYSMSHVRNFIDELGDSDVSMLDIILDPLNETIVEHDPNHTTQTWNSMFSVLKAVMWDNVPARKWTQSMGFTIYDVDLDGETDHTGALLVFRVLNLAIDMNGVLEDSILFWGGPDVRPAGYTWNIWKEIFRFQYNAMWVW